MRPSRSRRLATNFAVLIPMAKADSLSGQNGRGVDPDNASGRIHQRPTRIAGIQGSVGLNHVIDQAPGIRPQRPSQRAHYTCGNGGLKTIGRANGDGDLADAQFLRVAQFGRDQARLIDANNREITGGILADQGRGHMTPVGQSRRYAGGFMHDVAVGEDEAVGREDKSRAATLAFARFSRARASCRLRNGDMHDRRADALDGAGDRGGVRVQQSPVRRAMVSYRAEIACCRGPKTRREGPRKAKLFSPSLRIHAG